MSFLRQLAVAGGLGASLYAAMRGTRRSVEQWDNNPDPLLGVPVSFPVGLIRTVTTDDGARIHTITAGTTHGAPTIAMVNGLTSNHDDWGPIAGRLLEAGFQVMAIDQRGHGNSTVGSDEFAVPRLGADLAQVFETLDLRDVILIGHSMGGMAAMTLAVDRPDLASERVRALVLIATAATMSDLRYQIGLRLGSIAPPIDLANVSTDPSDPVKLGAAAAFGHAPSSFMIEQVLASAAKCPEKVRLAATAGLAGYDISERISNITLPTLVIAGTRDLLTPFSENEAIAAAIDGARLERMAGAGHLVIWERAEQIARRVAAFAREV